MHKARLWEEQVSKALRMIVRLEHYQTVRQPSRMFPLLLVSEKVVGPHRADGEELWVATRPKGPSLRQYPPAPSEEQHSLH